MRIVCRDEEQYRFTVVPGTSPKPARSAVARPMLNPCSPPGEPVPMIRSSISSLGSSGTFSRSLVMICALISSGRISVSEPLKARPIGLLAVATMTGSVAESVLIVVPS